MSTEIESLSVDQRTEVAKLYFAAAQEAAKEYDQRIFWLVAGAAAVFAYLQSQLPDRANWLVPCVLVLGWLSLFVALVAIMFSFLKASATHHLWAKHWLWDNAECGDEAAAAGKVISRANWVAFVALFLGMAMVAFFLAVNFFLGGPK